MKIQIDKLTLQQARKNAGIPLSTMALILKTDTSNLSKCERGIRKPSSELILSYHLITNAPIGNLFRNIIYGLLDNLKECLEEVLNKLSREFGDPKTDVLIDRLSDSLDNLKCLKELHEKNGK